jgi:hypothetical protein
VIGVVLGLAGSLVGFATVARTTPEGKPYGEAIGPRMPEDTGPGELLVAVVGGVYESKGQAVAANEAIAIGDLQGYYVVPVSQFGGFREQLGQPGEWALVSVFRTDEGAQEFADLLAMEGHPAAILPERVQSFGGDYAGLGQEANPDGSGPLTGPIKQSLPQRDSAP